MRTPQRSTPVDVDCVSVPGRVRGPFTVAWLVAAALLLAIPQSGSCAAGDSMVGRVVRVQRQESGDTVRSMIVQREEATGSDLDCIVVRVTPETQFVPGGSGISWLAAGRRVEVAPSAGTGADEAAWTAARISLLSKSPAASTEADPDLSAVAPGALLPADVVHRFDSRCIARALLRRLSQLTQALSQSAREVRQAKTRALDHVDLTRTSDVVMRVPLENLSDESTARQYLARGFLNQHQTAKTRGTYLPDVRARIENDLAMLLLEPAYNPAPNNPVHEIRPKYALLNRNENTDIDELPSAGENYGSVFIAFKSAVKERSTWTKHDSLTMVIQRFTPPLDPMSAMFDLSPLSGVYSRNVFPEFYASRASGVFGTDVAIQVGWSAYSEVQIWGKLDFSDVKAIYVLDTEREAFMQSAGAKLLLRRFDLPVETYRATVEDNGLRLRIVAGPIH